MTKGATHEIATAREVDFPKGSVVVVNRGYLNFSWLYHVNSTGVFFVKRTNTNTACTVNESYENKGDVLWDQNIILITYKGKKDYPGRIRIVRYLILLLRFLKEKAEYDWNLFNMVAFMWLGLFVKITHYTWLDHPFNFREIADKQDNSIYLTGN